MAKKVEYFSYSSHDYTDVCQEMSSREKDGWETVTVQYTSVPGTVNSSRPTHVMHVCMKRVGEQEWKP